MIHSLNKRFAYALVIFLILILSSCSGTAVQGHEPLPAKQNQNVSQTQDKAQSSQDTSKAKIGQTSDATNKSEAKNESKNTNKNSDTNADTNSSAVNTAQTKNNNKSLEKVSEQKNTSHATSPISKNQEAKPEIQKTVTQQQATVSLIIEYPKEAKLSSAEITCPFTDNESVLDMLVKYGKGNKIPVVYSGMKSSAYIEGINGVFEFDYGAESGWTYTVNGVVPQISAGAYTLKAGDIVKWTYVYKLSEALGK